VQGFTIRPPLAILIVCLAILLPVFGASLLALWVASLVTTRARA